MNPIQSKKRSKKQAHSSRKQKEVVRRPVNFMHAIILLAYIFGVTFTPNLMALDTNAPKFVTMAVLNLLAFAYLISERNLRQNPGYFASFFTTKVGLAYLGLLLFTLLSFTQAINLVESLLQFTKRFTIFSSAFIIGVILIRDLRMIKLVAITVAGILLFDSLSVFYYIGQFINGEIRSIMDIKSVYSNKNILASALFAKIPFALWLFVYEKKWLKRLAWTTMMLGMTATLFMAARAFYVGLIVMTLAFIAYSVVNYLREKEKQPLIQMAAYLGALVLAIGIFTFTQRNLYPQASGRHTAALGEQLGSIAADDSSTRIRLNAWQWSLNMIREYPLLGVGTGNWKIYVLKYENQEKHDFIYSYKAHNDFLEITASTGIPGGLMYLGLYLLIAWAFLNAYFHRRQSQALYKYLFLAVTGMLFFSFDAFFNFPHDRPEMMILFALYIGIGAAGSFYLNKVTALKSGEETLSGDENAQTEHPYPEKGKAARSRAILEGGSVEMAEQDLPRLRPWMQYVGASVIALLMVLSVWVLYLNFQSSKLQRVVYQEIQAGNLRQPADRFLQEFGFMPNISIWGESISTLKARYLINEERNQDAIDVLRPDLLNPWDGRREFYMAMAFNNMGKHDSVIHYSLLTREVKPNYFRNIHLLTQALEHKGRYEEVAYYLEDYLQNFKRSPQAWIAATAFYNSQENIDRAWELIEEAIEIHPRDSLIQRQHRFLTFRKHVEPHRPLYNQAIPFFQSQQYARALPILNEYLAMVPFDEPAYRMRAITRFHLGQHENALADLNTILEETGQLDPSLINLRGACYQALGDMDSACRDFEASMRAGNQSGITNYNRFCANRE